MSRIFLTGLNLNQNELQNAKIQNLSVAPGSPTAGQIYYNTVDNTLRYYNGTGWLTLAQGGSVTDAINNAINLLTTDDIEEGSSNLYYTDERAQDAVAAAIAAGTHENIIITYDDVNNKISFVAENGVADSTTSDLAEGSNLYYTDGRARAAISDGDGITYNSTTGVVSADIGTGLEIIAGQIAVDTDTIATHVSVAEDIANHNLETSSVHGVTGNVVGTSDAQTLTNKTLGSGTVLSASVDANGNTITDLGAPSNGTDAATKDYVDTEVSDHSASTSGVHGVTGTLVGTTDLQTISNKIISDSSLGSELSAGNFIISNVATPVSAGDAANKQYVDDAVAGLSWKESAHLLATSNVALTGSTGDLVIDGHAALTASHNGYRLLLTAQSTDSENGIYVYNEAAGSYTLTRSTDADAFGELTGASVYVLEGTTYGGSAWVQSNHYLTSFAGQDWVQFNGASQITAGDGLTKSGNVINAVGTADKITVSADAITIAETYAGQASIDTVGTITSGTWNGTTIAVADGGTGATTAAGARANLGATTKYTATNAELTPVSNTITWVVTHNMGIRTVVAQVYDLDGFDQVEVDVERTNTNEVTLRWVSATTVLADSYQVVIVG